MIEAMALGLPCIVTDCPCGGARMMIKNKYNGILVECGNKMQMVEAMSEVAKNKEFANVLSKNALKVREDLAVEKILDMWVNII